MFLFWVLRRQEPRLLVRHRRRRPCAAHPILL